MTEARLQEIRAAAEAAYPGTWEWDPDNLWISVQDEDDGGTIVLELDEEPSDENLGFLLRAREDVLALLDRVAQLEAMWDAMKKVSIQMTKDRRELVQRLFQATHWDPGAESWVIPASEAGVAAMYDLSNLFSLDLPGEAEIAHAEDGGLLDLHALRTRDAWSPGHVELVRHEHVPHVGEDEGVDLAGSASAARANLERFAPPGDEDEEEQTSATNPFYSDYAWAMEPVEVGYTPANVVRIGEIMTARAARWKAAAKRARRDRRPEGSQP
jgi:hypothetical protein